MSASSQQQRASSTSGPSRASSPGVARAALLLATTVALGSGAGCAPGASGAGGGAAPAPARPAEQRPRTESCPTTSTTIPPGPVAFAYAAAGYRYVVSTEATIELSADSGGARRSDSRAATAYVSYRVAPGQPEAARAVTGTVDSFTVTPAASPTGATGSASEASVPFRGIIDPARRHVELKPATAPTTPAVGAPAGECTSPAEALLAAAREAIVVPPPTLRVGDRWTDSVVTVVCRGDVPLTTRTLHEYRVAGVERRDGADALHLTRASTIGLSGQGWQRGMSYTVAGRGTGRADLYLDPTNGRFLGGTGESTVELQLDTPGLATQRVRQRGRLRVELQQ